MDKEHLCSTCNRVLKPAALEVCKELGHDIDYEDNFSGNYSRSELGLKKNNSKRKVPKIEKVVKGKFGDVFVESIYIDGTPHFLANINGEIKFSERFELDGKIIEPITEQDTPY